MGVFLSVDRVTYEDAVMDQIAKAKKKFGEPNLQALLDGDETWEIR
jgi:hypothetical protein